MNNTLIGQIVFEDEEAQALPTRVYLAPGAVYECLTEASNYRRAPTRRVFRNVYPDLATLTRTPHLIARVQGLASGNILNRRRALALQLVVLDVVVVVGFATVMIKRNGDLGAALGGALFALEACVQACLFWFYC